MQYLTILLALGVLSQSQAASETLSLRSPTTRTHLLELYTSEGCSSCPPADRWLSSLVDDPRLWRDLIPVAFHVDYWDYIGWPDRFASPAFSERQRAYARNRAIATVYTPSFILNGVEWRQWFSRPTLALEGAQEVGSLALRLDSGHVEAAFAPATDLPEVLELHLAVLGFDLTSVVTAGENRGRRLVHDFVILGYRRASMPGTHNAYALRIDLPAARFEAPRRALAAWLSFPDDPRPIQAVGGWLSGGPGRSRDASR